MYSFKTIYQRAYSKDRNYVCVGIMDKTSYDVEIIYETTDLSHAEDKEKEFIKMYGVVYDGTGTLTNLTKGGRRFEASTNYTARSVSVRKKNGTLTGVKAKPVYMYSLDGIFIEKIPSLKGFYTKYKYGDIDSQCISAAIRNKREFMGYYFSFDKYDVLDISQYRRNFFDKRPLVQYDITGNPIKLYLSVQEIADLFNLSFSSTAIRIKKEQLIGGYSFKRVNFIELPKIFNK